jgi:hypothetical protein
MFSEREGLLSPRLASQGGAAPAAPAAPSPAPSAAFSASSAPGEAPELVPRKWGPGPAPPCAATWLGLAAWPGLPWPGRGQRRQLRVPGLG